MQAYNSNLRGSEETRRRLWCVTEIRFISNTTQKSAPGRVGHARAPSRTQNAFFDVWIVLLCSGVSFVVVFVSQESLDTLVIES